MSRAAIAAEVVSRDELVTLARLGERYAAAKKAVSDVERSLEAARLALAEKVLGTETTKDLRLMDPEQVEELMADRHKNGLWKAARNAPPFVFLRTSSGRYPAWKSLFVSLQGEAAAEKIVAETPTFYSYRVDVAV
jgi:hypothetical protein